jgi:hypothetical protein
LRNLLHGGHRAEDPIGERHVFDRILGRGLCLAVPCSVPCRVEP